MLSFILTDGGVCQDVRGLGRGLSVWFDNFRLAGFSVWALILALGRVLKSP